MAIVKQMHLLLLAMFTLATYHTLAILDAPPQKDYDFVYNQYGGQLKYVSVLNGLLQCMFYGLCVLNDTWGTESPVSSQRSVLQKSRDWVFMCIIFPICMYVCSVFWVICILNRELIFPAEFDSFYPLWLNHTYHTLPIIGALAELYLVRHFFQRGAMLYVPICLVNTSYVVWMYYIHYTSGVWLYRMLGTFGSMGLIMYLTTLLGLNAFYAHVGSQLHHKIWGTSGKPQERTHGKKA